MIFIVKSFPTIVVILFPQLRNLKTPEKGRRTYRPKHSGNNNKDEDNSPKTLNDKNSNYEMTKT